MNLQTPPPKTGISVLQRLKMNASHSCFHTDILYMLTIHPFHEFAEKVNHVKTNSTASFIYLWVLKDIIMQEIISM
jgi:hypothetical protein